MIISDERIREIINEYEMFIDADAFCAARQVEQETAETIIRMISQYRDDYDECIEAERETFQNLTAMINHIREAMK